MLIGDYLATYRNTTKCGFKQGHLYKIHISKDEYVYIVEEIYELNEKNEIYNEMYDDGISNKKGYITYASEKSIRMYWDIQEDVTEL